MDNKSPAFQFYPKDFLTDEKVINMSDVERGQYIKLLCLEWINVGLKLETLNDSSDLVQSCFEKKGKLYINPRLEKEREKQKRWREKSRQGGVASGKARKQGNIEAPLKGGSDLVEPKGNSSSSSSSSSSLKDNTKNKDDSSGEDSAKKAKPVKQPETLSSKVYNYYLEKFEESFNTVPAEFTAKDRKAFNAQMKRLESQGMDYDEAVELIDWALTRQGRKIATLAAMFSSNWVSQFRAEGKPQKISDLYNRL